MFSITFKLCPEDRVRVDRLLAVLEKDDVAQQAQLDRLTLRLKASRNNLAEAIAATGPRA